VRTDFVDDTESHRPARFKDPPRQKLAAPPAPTPAPVEPPPPADTDRWLSPADVADQIVAAIRADRFYVLTHPEQKPLVRERLDAILAATRTTP
jgi:hypothetical protein